MATIRRNGPGWQAIIRRKGHKTRCKNFPKKALAERWARQQEEELSTTGVQTVGERMTVAMLLENYEREMTPGKRSSNREVSRSKIITAALGASSLAMLRAEDVIDFVDERRESVSSDTVRKELNTLSVAIDAGMALWGLRLPANPVHTAKAVLRVTKTLIPGVRRDRRPSEAELTALVSHAPGVMPKMILFAIETAMRRGELANMQPEHRRGNILLIPATKTDRPRQVPLTERAAALFDEVGGKWGMKPDSISQAFNRTCAARGIPDLRFHDLRHEAASRMIERGLSIAEVAAITGQSFQVLQRYTHITPQHLEKRLRQGT